MSIQQELYPFSTQNSQAIPLDVIDPLAHITNALTTTFANVTIPSDWEICTLYSDVDAYVDMAPGAYGTPVDGTSYADLLFLPSKFVVTARIKPGTIRVRAVIGAGRIQIQHIQKWAALALPRQIAQKLPGG